ncbi:hypothetical protein IMSAG013_00069 [Clostridiales bacterium]|nr:hypothetical protein IMSAG013_00069 [Clostridiales bacterium]
MLLCMNMDIKNQHKRKGSPLARVAQTKKPPCAKGCCNGVLNIKSAGVRFTNPGVSRGA